MESTSTQIHARATLERELSLTSGREEVFSGPSSSAPPKVWPPAEQEQLAKVEADMEQVVAGVLDGLLEEAEEGEEEAREPDQAAVVASLTDALPLVLAGLSDQTVRDVGVAMGETFRACTYDNVPCDMAGLRHFVDRRYGNCFVFNWNGTRSVRRSSKDHGLFLRLDVQRDEYMTLTESVGMRLGIHEPGVLPVPYVNGFNVAPGHSLLFDLLYEQVEHAGPPHSPCVAAANRSSFFVEGGYSLDGCLESCVQAAVVEQCHCLDPTKPPVPQSPDLAFCGMHKKKCLDSFLRSEKALHNEFCDKCLNPCAHARYLRTQTHVTWPQDNEIVAECAGAYIGEGRWSEAYQRCVRRAQRNTVSLRVKVNKLSHRKYREKPTVDIWNVFSSVGGSMGIALGMSVLSLAELLLFSLRFIRAMIQ